MVEQRITMDARKAKKDGGGDDEAHDAAPTDGQGIHVVVLDEEEDGRHGRTIGGYPESTSRRTDMIAEHHKGPLSNVHATQAGNAGDCTSSAHSSLPWRRVGRVFAATVLTGFVLNEIWEIAQMFAYVEPAGRSWTSALGLCTWAAVGDAEIILAFTPRARWLQAI
jgi:hypothetical protein